MTELTQDNRKELQEVIECYSDMLFKIAYLRLKNMEDAEDVVQEAFYQYLKREEGFESTEHRKAWLIKVTLNGCRKVWRSAWNRHRSDEEDVNYGQISSKQFLGENHMQGPEEAFVSADRSRILWETVMSLPAKYTDVIHLFYYEELSIKAIADITGRKESTITSQLTRGRELLKRKLKGEWDFA